MREIGNDARQETVRRLDNHAAARDEWHELTAALGASDDRISEARSLSSDTTPRSIPYCRRKSKWLR